MFNLIASWGHFNWYFFSEQNKIHVKFNNKRWIIGNKIIYLNNYKYTVKKIILMAVKCKFKLYIVLIILHKRSL